MSIFRYGLLLWFFIRKINKQFPNKCVLQNVQIIILMIVVWLYYVASGLPRSSFTLSFAWLKKHLNTKQHCFGRGEEKKTISFVIFLSLPHFGNRSTYIRFNAEYSMCPLLRHRHLEHDNIFHGICFSYVFDSGLVELKLNKAIVILATTKKTNKYQRAKCEWFAHDAWNWIKKTFQILKTTENDKRTCIWRLFNWAKGVRRR